MDIRKCLTCICVLVCLASRVEGEKELRNDQEKIHLNSYIKDLAKQLNEVRREIKPVHNPLAKAELTESLREQEGSDSSVYKHDKRTMPDWKLLHLACENGCGWCCYIWKIITNSRPDDLGTRSMSANHG